MRRSWGYAAMLLLGISLSVGFYEGRALVQNTARALSQATTITDEPGSLRERRRDADRIGARVDDEAGVAAAVERKRRARRGGPLGAAEDEGSRLIAPSVDPRERIELLRSARPQHGVRAGVGGRLAIPQGKALPEPREREGQLDTGLAETKPE